MDLDDTDAHFVDIIHTGAGILGQWGPTGHVDFYVNGGSSQPGCATTSLLRKYDPPNYVPVPPKDFQIQYILNYSCKISLLSYHSNSIKLNKKRSAITLSLNR